MEFANYLMTVAGAASLGIIADIINNAVAEKRKGLYKYIRFGISLCVVSAVVLPLMGKSIKEGFLTVNSAEYYSAEISASDSLYILEKECEESILRETSRVLSEPPAEVEIRMELIDDVPTITYAVIVLETADDSKIEEVRKISDSLLGVETEVTVKGINERIDE